MTYTAADIVTVIAALGVLLAGLGAITVNVIVALRTGTKIDQAAAKTDGLVAKVEQVHVLTNSNLSAVKLELATAAAQILALRELVTDLKAQRGKAEVATALATPVPRPLQDTRAGDHTIDKIDATTERIEGKIDEGADEP